METSLTSFPSVSIIIPLYNAENFIAATIQSAINQTWHNKEIIIIDDGSTDKSLQIAKQFENETVKIFVQQNAGASVARNYGLKHAKGEYIQFLDADDLLSENKIKAQIDLLISYPDHIGLCGTVHFQDGTDPFSQPLNHDWISIGSDDPVDFLIKLYGGALIGPQYGGMIQPNAWLTPKLLIDKAGGWNEMRNPDDDGEFFCRVILASKGIKYTREGINYYRKFNNNNSWSANKSYEASCNILRATELKAQYLKDKTTNPKAGLALSRLFWENAFNLYPGYKDLYLKAEKRAKALAPDFKYKPYRKGLNLILANLFGWKTVKYLQFLKHNKKLIKNQH